MPGKKGISLPTDQWDKLKKILPKIDNLIDVNKNSKSSAPSSTGKYKKYSKK